MKEGAFQLAVIELLGPTALTGGKLSAYEIAEMFWNASQASNSAGWKELFGEVALALKCLPSEFIDDNQHILDKAKSLSSSVAAQEPWAFAEEGRPANVVSAYLKSVNKNNWIKTYTIPLYPRAIPTTSQVPSDLANQIAWLKQRLDYPDRSSSHSFSHADMVSNVWPIIANLMKEVDRLNNHAKEKQNATD
jgi:hypothetical protein